MPLTRIMLAINVTTELRRSSEYNLETAHLREHLREVHGKIKDYACNQCDYTSMEDEQNMRSSVKNQ